MNGSESELPLPCSPAQVCLVISTQVFLCLFWGLPVFFGWLRFPFCSGGSVRLCSSPPCFCLFLLRLQPFFFFYFVPVFVFFLLRVTDQLVGCNKPLCSCFLDVFDVFLQESMRFGHGNVGWKQHSLQRCCLWIKQMVNITFHTAKVPCQAVGCTGCTPPCEIRSDPKKSLAFHLIILTDMMLCCSSCLLHLVCAEK